MAGKVNLNREYVTVPKNEEVRTNWFKAVSPEEDVRKTGNLYAFEDHFDLPNDAENWVYYKTLGKSLRMKKEAVPKIRDEVAISMTDSAKKRKYENIEMYESCKRKLEFEPQPSTSTFIQTTPQKSDMSIDSYYHSPSGRFEVNSLKNVPSDSQKKEHKKTQTYFPRSTRVRSIGTMTEIKTVSKSAMCVSGNFPVAVKSPVHSSPSTVHSISTSIYSPSSVTCSGSSATSFESKLMPNIKKQCKEQTTTKSENNSRLYLGIPKEEYFLIKLTESMLNLNYDKILVTLKKIRTNDTYARLSIDFGVSISTISNYFIHSVVEIAGLYQNLVFWPETWIVRRLLSMPFRYRYKDTQSIIDCFEIEIEVPSNPSHQAVTWRQYKECNTIKYLISCTPYGFVNFISHGFGGRITDFDIVESSGYLNVLVQNTAVMADRGFKNIASQIQRKNCTLIRPPSVSAGTVSSRKEVLESKRIASLRIYVERVIRRLREFEMLAPHACVNTHCEY